MFKDSVWYPNTPRNAAIVVMLVGMVILHHSSVLGLMDAGLLFGWLPIQLAFDLAYTILAVILLYWVYTVSPKGEERDDVSTPNDNPMDPNQ
jgi:uncharacterized membrane protein